ncbi:MAG: PDZ domain-containing protein [Bacteroidota bacterium]
MKKMSLFAMVLLMALPASGFRPNPADDDEGETKPQRGWLGVSIRDVDSKTAKKNNLKLSEGAYVTDVQEKSPAAVAGLEEGDVVTDVNGRAIYDADDLGKAIRRFEPGAKVTVTALRRGEKKTFQVTVGKMPKQRGFAFGFSRNAAPMIHMFRTSSSGLHFRDLNKQLGDYFGTPEGEGVLVEEVETKSAAEKAGFKAGDVILKFGKRTIDDVEDIWKAMDAYREDEKVDVEVLRKGAKKNMSLELESGDESHLFDSFQNDGIRHRMRIKIPRSHGIFRQQPDLRIEEDIDLEESLKLENLPKPPRILQKV